MITLNLGNKAVSGYEVGGVGIEQLVSNLIGTATVVAGILLVCYLVYGAIRYITAGGDEKVLTSAKGMITNAIVGLLLVVLATSIGWIVGKVLGVPIMTPPWGSLYPK